MINRPALNMQSILAEDESAPEENWMVSYIDVFVLMTTVFIALVVLYKPVQPVVEAAVISTEPVKTEPAHFIDEGVVASEDIEIVDAIESKLSDSALWQTLLTQWNTSLEEAIAHHELDDLVQLNRQSDVTELDIASRVLFNSGDAQLTRSGEAVLEKLLPVLKSTEGIIYVEGHTDDEPIETPMYPSNWELASARATEVLKFFVSEGMDKARFRAVSFGDTKPVVPNNSVQNRKRNRRVSLVIQRSLDEGAP